MLLCNNWTFKGYWSNERQIEGELNNNQLGFHQLLRTNKGPWKSLCLQYWNHFKQQLTQQSGVNYSKEGEYNLEWTQRESGKDWFWFSQYFAKVRIFQSEYYWEVWIGPTPGEKVNG